jgi:F0F1-type ATP synthase epsilon subunit
MTKKIKLSIFLPGRIFFESNVTNLIAPSSDRKIRILSGHCPLVSSFTKGSLSFALDNKPTVFDLTEGFIKIITDQQSETNVVVLCRTAVSAGE